MSKNELMVIFTRTYDFITWLMPLTAGFPRSQRFTIAMRLNNAALDFQERIIEANALRGTRRAEKLRLADTDLLKVRLYLRLSLRWEWIKNEQYQYASEQVAEIGRLLGGWLKTVASGKASPL
jgi:four helix bundle protein